MDPWIGGCSMLEHLLLENLLLHYLLLDQGLLQGKHPRVAAEQGGERGWRRWSLRWGW